jgi:hypothetical protein
MSGYGRVALLLLCCLAAPGAAAAQDIGLRGGMSTLEQASGAGATLSFSPCALDFFSGAFDGRIGLGASLKGEFGKSQFIVGDQPLQILSPVYGDQSRGFYARGVSVTIPLGERTRVTFFGGSTGIVNGSELFMVVRPNQAIGGVQLEHDLTKRLSIFSRSLFSSRQSVISGFDFHPNHRFRFGAQAGIGSNTPYLAVTGAYKADLTTLEASYVESQPQFRLVQVNELNYEEPIGENIHFRRRFSRALQFDYRRSNYQFNALNGTLTQFSGDNLSVAGRVGQTGWNVGYNQVSGDQVQQGIKTLRDSQQVTFGLNQGFGPIRVYASQYQPISGSANSSLRSFTTFMVKEKLNRWVSLRQVGNHSQNWNIAYGGEVHSNYVNLSVDYQTVYNLFGPGQGGFQQGVVLEGDVNLPGGARLFVGTDVTPDGRFLYRWGIRASLHGPYGGAAVGSSADEAPRMPRYVVRGKVLEGTTVAPIADFPVEIDSETAFTDERGEFSLRLFSGREVAARPDTKTPHQGFEYGLIGGPEKVRPVKNGPGEEYVWKVRKVRPAPTSGKSGLIVSPGSDGKTVTPAATPAKAPGSAPSRPTTPASGGGGGGSGSD